MSLARGGGSRHSSHWVPSSAGVARVDQRMTLSLALASPGKALDTMSGEPTEDRIQPGKTSCQECDDHSLVYAQLMGREGMGPLTLGAWGCQVRGRKLAQ